MSWHVATTGSFGRTTQNAQDNAKEIYNVLYGLGWKLTAVASMLGNCEHESGYNPWRWQGDTVLPVGDPRIGTIGGGNTAHAYGLVQQDPAAKYIYREYAQALPTYGPNYSNQAGNTLDGVAQLQYLHWICSTPGGGEWFSRPGYESYYVPFTQFIAVTSEDLAYYTRVFFHCYERGTWADSRQTAAEYWYSYLQNYAPQPPAAGGFPMWLLYKMYSNNFKKGMWNI